VSGKREAEGRSWNSSNVCKCQRLGLEAWKGKEVCWDPDFMKAGLLCESRSEYLSQKGGKLRGKAATL
jgi:hypothetical protein